MKIDMKSWLAMGKPSVEVRINGIRQRYVTMADEKHGIVERFEMPLRPDPSGLKAVSSVCHGNVEIIMGDSAR